MKKSELKEMIRQAMLEENQLEVTEAKKDKEEEEDIEIEDIEGIEDIEDTEIEDIPSSDASGITGDEKKVQDSLESALIAAKELGDEKLINQIGNSITFFTRSHVVGSGDESLEEDFISEDKQELNEGKDVVLSLIDDLNKYMNGDLDKKEIQSSIEIFSTELRNSLFEGNYDTQMDKIIDSLSRMITPMDSAKSIIQWVLDNPDDLPEEVDEDFFYDNVNQIEQKLIQMDKEKEGYDPNFDPMYNSEIDYRDNLEEEVEGSFDEDVVKYNGVDHIITRRENDRIYIRRKEDSAMLGKMDEFWVKPQDIEGEVESYQEDLYERKKMLKIAGIIK